MRAGAGPVAAPRRALVTGASSGLGRAFALGMAARGVDVVLVGRGADRLEAPAEEVRAAGASAEVLVADLAGEPGRRSVAERIADGTAPVDLVVNSAGLLGRIAPLAEQEPADLEEAIAVGITAIVDLTRASVAAMPARGGGAVLNVSSFMGYVPAPQGAVYAAAKAFTTSFSESVHCEVAGRGVHVTALCPGSVRTGLHRDSGRSGGRLGRYLEPDTVVEEGLAAVRAGEPICVPGMEYRIKVKLGAVLPRAAVRRRVLRIWRQ
ncbi:hypothetical protein HDA32_000536 [Spinactinospora alkalitolerans]|uniref:Ketoreductase domain-containing protein n=1 Tax=Spinactinospora alkalitolerans TaxID=687207 RepID=A0A852TMB3_9ACTN|nr:SDR family NAD(P)-dependent oxidoreductase [Spinactinospora alkalitolerans]NYE45416.1 hypothetical protein [Spinactinospora alkalitolerans]